MYKSLFITNVVNISSSFNKILIYDDITSNIIRSISNDSLQSNDILYSVDIRSITKKNK